MKFWEATTFGNGIIMLIYDARRDAFVFRIKAGFMEGEYPVSENEIRKLKTFMRDFR